MKGSFVELLKKIFPKWKGDVGENETQGALVMNFQTHGRFSWTSCYWVQDDLLSDILSKSFENTEQWHMLDVIGKGEKMELWKDSNDLVKAKGLCNVLQ